MFVLEDVSVIVLGNADVALAVDEDENKVAVIDDEASDCANVVENSDVTSVIVAVSRGFIIVDSSAGEAEDFSAPIRSE